MLSPTFFINVFYLVLFCIHVCVDDVIEKKLTSDFMESLQKYMIYVKPFFTVMIIPLVKVSF